MLCLPTTVWVLADVYESDLADVRLNTPVDVRVAAYLRRTIPAHIVSVNPTVDPCDAYGACTLPAVSFR